jgi:NAD(P)-dependent dehydrogenase (short-subunit alcohol dehydrogenase family)
MDFDGRNVVVTGGTGALGVAVVTALIEAGAVCHIPYRHDAEADRSGLRDQARVKLYAGLELSDGEAVERLFTGLPTLWASIHLAGGFAFGALKVIDEATLRQQIESNFVTCALCCRAALRTFARGGSGGSASEGGRIVNVAARPALEWRTGAHMAAYTASKAAVAALTMALAEEVAKDGILVNAVAPSIMDTQSNRKAMPKADFSTWPKVEEVAQTILFLASPANAVTRGAIVPVYGRA